MAKPDFDQEASSKDGSGICLGVVKKDGRVFSWGKSNANRKLCRKGRAKEPALVDFAGAEPTRIYVGGNEEAGHSAILDKNNDLWMCGCDRWQQLGMGSAAGGASGYTWKKIWEDNFRRNDFVSSIAIRDVALGGDHSAILSENRKDVYTFGKGAEGQLGLKTKPFVHAASKSPVLSAPGTAAVCAIRDCSLTLDCEGNVMNKAGKCSRNIKDALEKCRARAESHGLIDRKQRAGGGV